MQRATVHRILIISGIAIVLVYLLFALFKFTKKRQDFFCTNVEITLLDKGKVELINVSDIERLLTHQQVHPAGKSLSEIDTELIEKTLNSSETVKYAECYSTPSGVIHIDVRQRIPKFKVIGKENYYIDTERQKIKTSGNYTAYVPIVSGYVTEEMAAGDLFDFITFLEDNSFWDAQIEQIYVRPDKKVELVPRVGDSIILLGTLDNYESKLKKLKKLYINVFNSLGWNNYKMIDLQYKGQIVCTK